MKPRRVRLAFPLAFKIALWLVLNLLLVAVVGVIFFLVGSDGAGLDTIARSAAGERIQAAANLLALDLRNGTAPDAETLHARLGESDAIAYSVVTNDGGTVIAGAKLSLPEPVHERLRAGINSRRGPGAGRPPGGPPPRGPGPPDEMGPNLRHGDPGPPDLARGRSLVRAGDPAAWWMVVRMPPIERDGRPVPVSLVAHAPSLAAVVTLLDLRPWFYAGATVLGISLLFWFPLVRGVTRAVAQLDTATRRIAEGHFDTRVPAKRRDELGHLGESVNQMAARLDALVNGQKRFLGDIAHELGSPLGRLQVATEILETRADPSLRAQVGDVREEVQQMATLVGELLAFTKAGMRPREAAHAVVPLDEVVAAVLAREGAGIRVTATVPSGLSALADRELLTRAIANLVRNALRYAADASAPVTVTAARANGHVIIAIEDEGPGVPAGSLPRLGEPFYRPESARTRETGGVGLGLAIVRSCVSACGGDVAFSNRTPRGFRAELRLTAAATAAVPSDPGSH